MGEPDGFDIELPCRPRVLYASILTSWRDLMLFER